MSEVPIQIIRRSDKVYVDAVLHTDLPPAVLYETQKDWGPMRLEAARKLYSAGRHSEIPQHFSWDWQKKAQKLSLLAYRCMGIECEGKIQGLLLAELASYVAKLAPDSGKSLLYIDFLESAPWNLSGIVAAPLYSGIGLVLMRAAVELSCDEGYHGRIGLHALPQAEEFYRNVCEMDFWGTDVNYGDLPYYEMTREVAARFVLDINGGAK